MKPCTCVKVEYHIYICGAKYRTRCFEAALSITDEVAAQEICTVLNASAKRGITWEYDRVTK